MEGMEESRAGDKDQAVFYGSDPIRSGLEAMEGCGSRAKVTDV